MDTREIIDAIRSIAREHFCKSMTSYGNHRIWQDVYIVPWKESALYVKFTISNEGRITLLSFKKKQATPHREAASMELCPHTGHEMTHEVRPMKITYQGISTTVEMPGWYCRDCGEGIHNGREIAIWNRGLNRLKARHRGLLLPGDVRRIRKRLGLTQKDAGRLIGGGPNAFQKYESGDVVVSHAIMSALLLLDGAPQGLDVLRRRAPLAPAA